MPFRSKRNDRQPTRVIKAEVVNRELAAELDRLTRPYREAIDGLFDVVRDAAANVTGDNLDQFRILLNDGIVADLQRQLGAIANAEARQALRSGAQAAAEIPRQFGVAFSFNGKDPRAIAWARQRCGTLIAQIESETLEAIRLIIADSLNAGIPLGPTTQRIERVIGLHDRWQRAVDNSYRKDVARYLQEGLSLDVAERRAQVSADKYRKRLIRTRAKNIARTELAAAQNYGQYLTWIQASDKGLINIGKTMKEWVAGPSGWRGVMVCDICAPMDGQRVPITSSFSNGVLMPPAHPNCRCRAILIPPEVP
jgi:hypothetical protein